jgi:hypothetical protein
MRDHAVQHRAHDVLADAVMYVTAAVIARGEGGKAALVLGGALKVRTVIAGSRRKARR